MAQKNSTHESRLQSMEQWRNGNGAPGAEDRIQRLEKDMVKREDVPHIVRYVLREEKKMGNDTTVTYFTAGATMLMFITLVLNIAGVFG